MQDPSEREAQAFTKKVDEAIAKHAPNLRFPINNFDELEAAMGGPQGKIEWNGVTHTVGHLRTVLRPSFPITSREDLHARMLTLEANRPGNKVRPTKLGDSLPLSPSLEQGTIPSVEKAKEIAQKHPPHH